MTDPISDWLLAGEVIATVFICAVLFVGAYTLFGPQQPEDNYHSPTIRDNVRRVK